MIAIYVHDPRQESFDRARMLAASLEEHTILVSAHPPRLGWTTEWRLLPDSDVTTWAAWLQVNKPATVIVDGPPEHARAVREIGSTLVVVATPGGGEAGERGSAYADAAAILAPWPPAAVDWPAAWRERTVHVGALGWRADEELRRTEAFRAGVRQSNFPHCVALWPTSAGPDARERRDIGVETPGWRWTYAPQRDLHEPGPIWSALIRAEVAVCAPTLTNLVALARFRVPAVLAVPERPSPAMAFLAEAAARTAPVVVAKPWPRPEAWPGLLAEARALDGSAWSAWDPARGLAELSGLLTGGASAGAGDVLVPV
ncbi:MAG: hypothetical protein ACJ72D_02250 [Marmoricola sp.]